MHGIIHLELKKYLEARHGPTAWRTLLEQAGVATKMPYERVGHYPDEELHAIVAAASRVTGTAVAATLEDFGEFIAPDLIGMFPRLIRPEWRTLDVLANVEQTIHTVVRLRNPGAQPPLLRCGRLGAETVVITYSSPRRLCALARGIVRGLARHFGEQVEIREDSCMHRNAPSCVIVVRVQRARERAAG